MTRTLFVSLSRDEPSITTVTSNYTQGESHRSIEVVRQQPAKRWITEKSLVGREPPFDSLNISDELLITIMEDAFIYNSLARRVVHCE